MTMSVENKQIVKNLQQELKGMGYDIKLGHIYEALAKVSGYNSWNVASAKNVEFVKTLNLNEKILKNSHNEEHYEYYKNEIFEFERDEYDKGKDAGRELVLSKSISYKAIRFIKRTKDDYERESRTKIFEKPWINFLNGYDEINDLFRNYRRESEDPDRFFEGFFDGIIACYMGLV